LLRTRASCGSLDVLNELLEYEEGCDVDLTNIERETPLHLAVKYGEAELRALMVDSLLDAGAETRLGFTVTPSLPLSILMVPSVLKTRLAKWRGTTYVKMMRKRKLHSVDMKLCVAS
jgi:ankyrin repeat protein